MTKHYTYTIDHDSGFAPNVDRGVCSLCGCKTTTVEPGASTNSWVFGFGGNRTGRPGKLIYAMCVDASMAVADFEESYPKKSQYLEHAFPPVPWDAPVLVSKRFHYFGDAAIDLPKRLQHLVFRRRGCKLVTPSDARMLWTYVESVTNGFGRHGWPCNGDSKDRSSECGGN